MQADPPGSDPELQLGIDALNIVDVTLCALSLLGAMGIVISFVVDRQLRKIRHQLILGLAVADIIQSAAVLIPGAYDLVHRRISPNSPGCKASAFLYLTATWNNSFWTLAIATATYVILVHPMSAARQWLEKPMFHAGLWIASWLFCIINSTIGIILVPVVDVGGLCFWSRKNGPYADLILFVPRAITLVIVILLYIRLFLFFRRTQITNYSNSFDIKNSDDLPDFQEPAPIPEPRRPSFPWSININQYRKQSKDSDHTLVALENGSPRKDFRADRRSSGNSLLANSIPLSPRTHNNSNQTLENFAWPAKAGEQRPSRSEDVLLQPVPVASDTPPSLVRPEATPNQQQRSSITDFGVATSYENSSGKKKRKQKRPMSAAELNKRASVLMLLYPAAYVLLFSASFIRLVIHFVNQDDRAATTIFGAISRWLILSTGLVDAIIFLVVESIFRNHSRRNDAATDS